MGLQLVYATFSKIEVPGKVCYQPFQNEWATAASPKASFKPRQCKICATPMRISHHGRCAVKCANATRSRPAFPMAATVERTIAQKSLLCLFWPMPQKVRLMPQKISPLLQKKKKKVRSGVNSPIYLQVKSAQRETCEMKRLFVHYNEPALTQHLFQSSSYSFRPKKYKKQTISVSKQT